MIYHMAYRSSLSLPYELASAYVTGINSPMRSISNWRKALLPVYGGLNVFDKGFNIPIDSMQSGDIILWSSHIGMVAIDKPTGDRYIYQSNGTNSIANNCPGNLLPNRGPNMKPLNPFWLTNSNAFGGVYQVYRFDPACQGQSTLADQNGNGYTLLEAGNNCWTVQDLRATSYRNGDPIPFVTGTDWVSLTTGARTDCNAAQNGLLYNAYAVQDSRGICPVGWHVATDEDWKSIERELGMMAIDLNASGERGITENVGGKLKSLSGWTGGNAGALDLIGFSAVPEGARVPAGIGDCVNPTARSFQWTGTEGVNPGEQWRRYLANTSQGIWRQSFAPGHGNAVRCVKDIQ